MVNVSKSKIPYFFTRNVICFRNTNHSLIQTLKYNSENIPLSHFLYFSHLSQVLLLTQAFL